MMSELHKILSDIQKKLKVPKSQWNAFGKYNYRSCEDIVESIKQMLPEGIYLQTSDELSEVCGRSFIKSTASICSKDNKITTTSFAEMPKDKKGMDASQITGCSSSYARKYALNGLFAIDDTKDADTMDNSQNNDYEKLKCEMMVLIDRCKCGDDLNNMIAELKDVKHIKDSKLVLFEYLKEKAETIGYLFDKTKKRFEHA